MGWLNGCHKLVYIREDLGPPTDDVLCMDSGGVYRLVVSSVFIIVDEIL